MTNVISRYRITFVMNICLILIIYCNNYGKVNFLLIQFWTDIRCRWRSQCSADKHHHHTPAPPLIQSRGLNTIKQFHILSTRFLPEAQGLEDAQTLIKSVSFFSHFVKQYDLLLEPVWIYNSLFSKIFPFCYLYIDSSFI